MKIKKREGATATTVIVSVVVLGGLLILAYYGQSKLAPLREVESNTASRESQPNLIKPLQPYVSEIAGELEKVSPQRRSILEQIARQIVQQLNKNTDVQVTFICTSNSRRSHMSQAWAQTAAYYYGLDNVLFYSGGTEATACNIRTIKALRRVGFSIATKGRGDNPTYLLYFSDERPPIPLYSKLYNADDNPNEDFIALMCCSKADRTCAVVEGAVLRYPIHYVDPKECDDTSRETSEYDVRCRQIAREMFYIMSHVQPALIDRTPK